MVDWIYTVHGKIDLRMAALKCTMIGGVPKYSQRIAWGPCHVQQISPFSNKPACYTT
jgi:sodium/potassium-transporting ATPase subunit alpha